MMSNSWAGGPIAASGSGLTRLPLPVPVPQWLSLSGSQYPVPVAMLRHCWPAWGPTESRCHTVRQSHCDSHCGTVTVTRHTVTVTRSRCSAAAGWLQEVPRPRWPGVEIRLARSSQVGTGTVPTGPHGAPGTSGRARPGSGGWQWPARGPKARLDGFAHSRNIEYPSLESTRCATFFVVCVIRSSLAIHFVCTEPGSL